MSVPLQSSAAPVKKPASGILGLTDSRPVEPLAPSTTPISQHMGIQDAAVPTKSIGVMNTQEYLAQDAVMNVKGYPFRYGIVRGLSASTADGHWMPVNGGYLWSMDVHVDGTKAMRIHFTDVNLPAGAELVAYSMEEAFYITGPVTGQGPWGNGEFWAKLMPGATARVEMFLPAQYLADAQTESPFRIDSVVDAYHEVFKDDEGGIAAAGACHNVPACFSPTWDNMRKAEGRIDFVDGGSGFLCSGQLVNTVASDQTPYYLTAAHCISNNTVANTAEILWKYEKATCAAATATVGGISDFCTLVTTYGTADETLLMVEGALPSNMFWAGWVTAEPNSGQASTCLHHPAGDYMRISFGTKSNTPNCGGSSTNFMLLSWTSGVTEGGSSGSAIIRNDTQQIYGTLTCGGSACVGAGANGQPDSYSQFDRAYNVGGFAAPLNAGSDDNLEPNDTCATAVAISPGTYTNRIVKSTSEDWYKINIPNGGGISVSATFTHSWGNIDMQLYNSCGGSVLTSSTGTGNSEALSYTNSGAAANFFLRVYLASDTRNQYDLSISTIGPENDECPG
ncbi:MAG TPA: PPC domain-containing protein, partial [Phycisphaerales bacterium]|nr:PPC domain-containing protein [Phycisphaerales bacterium]